MKKLWTMGAAASAAWAVLGIAVPNVHAQSLCTLSATNFTKTVRNVTGTGPIQAGDDIEFTIMLCNTGANACISALTDNLDGLLGDTTDLDKVDMPGTVGCNGTPTWDGGTVCERGTTSTGPWSNQTTTQCGTACDPVTFLPPIDPDNLKFIVQPTPTNQLQPGNCFRWTLRAHVRDSIATSRCLCNTAAAPIDFLGAQGNSNDPNWTSLADPLPPIAPGCTDADTCPSSGECNTCARINRTNASCDLNGATLTFTPITPAKSALYVLSCAAADPRVNPDGMTGFVAKAAVASGDRFGSLTPVTPSELTLYQLGCACGNVVKLTKDKSASPVQIAINM